MTDRPRRLITDRAVIAACDAVDALCREIMARNAPQPASTSAHTAVTVATAVATDAAAEAKSQAGAA